MAEQYKTVREVIEMLDEEGIVIAMKACEGLEQPGAIAYAIIEALIEEIDPNYFDEEDED